MPNAMNLELPNNQMLALDETASGDIELTVFERSKYDPKTKVTNSDKYKQISKCTIPYERRDIVIRFLEQRPPF